MPLKIRIADIQNFETDQPIFIHDIETDIFVNLKNQDFDINLDAGNYSNRFEITFTNNSLSTIDTSFESLKIFQNNTNYKLEIRNPKLLNIKTFSLFDVSGKQVLSKRIRSTKKQYAYSTKTLSTGVYVAKITSENNRSFTEKVVIKNVK